MVKSAFLSLCLTVSPLAVGQTVNPATIVCDLLISGQPEASGCTHKYAGGSLYKTASAGGLVITVGIDEDSKYMRATFGLANNGPKPVDVIPNDFVIEESTPRSRTLHVVAPEKIAESEEKRAHRANNTRRVFGGFANVLSAVGGGSQQRSTTQTTSSGTISAHSSDGTYTNGTYDATSTSTTSSPDPAARQRAAEQIHQRNAAIAAANAQRNAAVSAENARLMQTALSANTVSPGGTIGGVVYFEGDKNAKIVAVRVHIAGTLYEFKFDFE